MFLGIDIGSSSVKAALFSDGGFSVVSMGYEGLKAAESEYPIEIVEKAVAGCCQKLFSSGAVKPDDIKGIGLCGHGPSILFIDAGGRAVSPLYTWQNTQAAGEAAALRNEWPGFRKDGSSWEAKIRRAYNRHPEWFKEGNTCLYPKDYIIYRLCGRRIIDSSAASTLYFFNRQERRWNPAGFPETVLPEVVDSWGRAGTTSGNTAGGSAGSFGTACGFPGGVPVYAGGIDAYCGMVGAGAVVPGIMVDETGTSTCLSRCYTGGRGRDWHVLPGLSLTMQTLSNTGDSLEWFRQLAGGGGGDISSLSGKIDPHTPAPVIFLPYLNGERSPMWDERASGAWIGLTRKTDMEQLFHAVLQGVGFAVYHNMQILEVRGGPCPLVHAVGGGIDDRWLQMKADITGKTYCKMKYGNGAAPGAALIAAVGAGALAPADIPGLLPVSGRFESDSRAHKAYAPVFQIYAGMYEKLKDAMHTLRELTTDGGKG
jgi:xylulokinase